MPIIEDLIIVIGILLIVYMIYLLFKRYSNPRINLGSIWLKKSPFFLFDVNKKATILYVFIILIMAIASVSDLVTRMLDFSN